MTTLRLNQEAGPYRAMLALAREVDAVLAEAGVDPKLAELVKLRVSQLNGCAFCLRMHSRDAAKLGETPERLAVLAAWWESQYFTPQERAALALAEEVTELPVPEPHDWDDGSLTEAQANAVAWLAVVMNGWNRIAISSHYPVGPGD